jgi:methionyl-tRNA formyltransferase
MRLIFMGTPQFAVPSLKKLIESSQLEVVAIFTQADKALNRKKEIIYSPVKQLALKNNLKIFQADKIQNTQQIIKNLNPDIIVTIAYGQIIPKSILEIPKYNCLNVHGSLLPKYRGASCLAAPILNADAETGITIMRMDEKMDTGPILKQFKIKLSGQETLQDIHDRLANLSAQHLKQVILDYSQGKIKEVKQDESKASYVKLTKKNDGLIDWQKPATIIEREIRAYFPWPGSFSYYQDKILKIREAKIYNKRINLKPGEVHYKDKKILIGTGQGILDILKLQLSGERVLSNLEFINGHNLDKQILKAPSSIG